MTRFEVISIRYVVLFFPPRVHKGGLLLSGGTILMCEDIANGFV